MKRKLSLLALFCALLLNPAPVLADGDFYVVATGGVGTKITSLPYTIESPGFYYVVGNLTCGASLTGITVNSDSVTIDLMGFRLTGLGGHCVYMSDRKNVEIRNGTVQGWSHGIIEEGSGQNHRVINVRAESNGNGVSLNGAGHLVKGCTISNCYATSSRGIFVSSKSTVCGNRVTNVDFRGIEADGSIISDNLVADCGSTGIYGSDIIRGNTVKNRSSGAGTGIESYGGSIIGNTVMNYAAGQTGISLYDYPMVMDQNTVSGPGTRYTVNGGTGSNIVWAGKSADNPWGSNAGHP